MNKACRDHPKVQNVGLEINRGYVSAPAQNALRIFSKMRRGPSWFNGGAPGFVCGPVGSKTRWATAKCLEGSGVLLFPGLELV